MDKKSEQLLRKLNAEGGRIQVLEPAWLRQKIFESGKKIMETNN